MNAALTSIEANPARNHRTTLRCQTYHLRRHSRPTPVFTPWPLSPYPQAKPIRASQTSKRAYQCR